MPHKYDRETMGQSRLRAAEFNIKMYERKEDEKYKQRAEEFLEQARGYGATIDGMRRRLDGAIERHERTD